MRPLNNVCFEIRGTTVYAASKAQVATPLSKCKPTRGKISSLKLNRLRKLNLNANLN